MSIIRRSYWIPGAYAPALSEKRNSFLRLLKNKGFKEENITKGGLYAIGNSTPLEYNKSHRIYIGAIEGANPLAHDYRRTVDGLSGFSGLPITGLPWPISATFAS